MQRLSCPIVILSEHQARFSDIGEVPEVLLSLRIYVCPYVTTNLVLRSRQLLDPTEGEHSRETRISLRKKGGKKKKKTSYRKCSLSLRVNRRIARRVKVERSLLPIISLFPPPPLSRSILFIEIDVLAQSTVTNSLSKLGTSRSDVRRRVRPRRSL